MIARELGVDRSTVVRRRQAWSSCKQKKEDNEAQA